MSRWPHSYRAIFCRHGAYSDVIRRECFASAPAVAAGFVASPAQGPIRRPGAGAKARDDGELSRPRRLKPAARHPGRSQVTALAGDQVRITYIGHSTFLIESPQLVRIATDYNDYVRPPILPDIVTMNHAHSTHYTDHPEPGIKHVLRGWGRARQAGAA